MNDRVLRAIQRAQAIATAEQHLKDAEYAVNKAYLAIVGEDNTSDLLTACIRLRVVLDETVIEAHKL